MPLVLSVCPPLVDTRSSGLVSNTSYAGYKQGAYEIYQLPMTLLVLVRTDPPTSLLRLPLFAVLLLTWPSGGPLTETRPPPRTTSPFSQNPPPLSSHSPVKISPTSRAQRSRRPFVVVTCSMMRPTSTLPSSARDPRSPLRSRQPTSSRLRASRPVLSACPAG